MYKKRNDLINVSIISYVLSDISHQMLTVIKIIILFNEIKQYSYLILYLILKNLFS